MSKHPKTLKVALVHDFLWSMRGGEKCLEVFAEMFPNADIYMLFGDRKKMSESILSHRIFFSFLQRFPLIKKYYRYTYFLWPFAIENFDLMDYDLVISTSASVSKGVITGLDTVHVSYMFTPMRYAWDLSFEYFNSENFSLWKRLIIPIFLHYVRIWDVVSTQRIDFLIAISEFVAKRIKKYYRRVPDTIIYPPVYTDLTHISYKNEGYFYAVAPFEPNKGGRLMVECAMKYGFKLKLIGDGSMKRSLQKLAKNYQNIEFLGYIPEKEKFNLISKAKALLFCGVEEFGIVPPEAISSGVPVVAYRGGGVVETVKEGFSGVFFDKQDVKTMKKAIDKLDEYYLEGRFVKEKMRETMKKFSKERFVKEFEKITSLLLKR